MAQQQYAPATSRRFQTWLREKKRRERDFEAKFDTTNVPTEAEREAEPAGNADQLPIPAHP